MSDQTGTRLALAIENLTHAIAFTTALYMVMKYCGSENSGWAIDSAKDVMRRVEQLWQ